MTKAKNSLLILPEEFRSAQYPSHNDGPMPLLNVSGILSIEFKYERSWCETYIHYTDGISRMPLSYATNNEKEAVANHLRLINTISDHSGQKLVLTKSGEGVQRRLIIVHANPAVMDGCRIDEKNENELELLEANSHAVHAQDIETAKRIIIDSSPAKSLLTLKFNYPNSQSAQTLCIKPESIDAVWSFPLYNDPNKAKILIATARHSEGFTFTSDSPQKGKGIINQIIEGSGGALRGVFFGKGVAFFARPEAVTSMRYRCYDEGLVSVSLRGKKEMCPLMSAGLMSVKPNDEEKDREFYDVLARALTGPA